MLKKFTTGLVFGSLIITTVFGQVGLVSATNYTSGSGQNSGNPSNQTKSTKIGLNEIKPIGGVNAKTTVRGVAYGFYASSGGKLTMSGGCTTKAKSVVYGKNSIQVFVAKEGLYDQCKINVVGPQGYTGELKLTPFYFDKSTPTIKDAIVAAPLPDVLAAHKEIDPKANLVYFPITDSLSGIKPGTCNFSFVQVDSMDNHKSRKIPTGRVYENYDDQYCYSVIPDTSDLPNLSLYGVPFLDINFSVSDKAGNVAKKRKTIGGGIVTAQDQLIDDSLKAQQWAENMFSGLFDSKSLKLKQTASCSSPRNSVCDVTFSAEEPGVITKFTGDCTGELATINQGSNTITIKPTKNGIINCSIEAMSDTAVSNATGFGETNKLKLSEFVYDTQSPTIGAVNITPSIMSDGVAVVDQTIPRANIWATVNDNVAINFVTCEFNINGINTIAGHYNPIWNRCQLNGIKASDLRYVSASVSDLAKNYYGTKFLSVSNKNKNAKGQLLIKPLVIFDPSIVELKEVTPVTNNLGDQDPAYTFSSSVDAYVNYHGSCYSESSTISVGENTVYFKEMADGSHNDCSITVVDGFRHSGTLNISLFSIDTSKKN